MSALSQIRRLEAVSFRSFPATSTYYDGTWAIRLTAGHPAKRLNSVSPLDPADHSDVDRRLELARHRFESFGRPLVFRQSPLAPPELELALDRRGWDRFDETLVMVSDLSALDLSSYVDHLPVRDVGLWVDSYLELSDEAAERKPGLVEVISSIEPQVGLFVQDGPDRHVSAIRCVCDNDLAGVFDMVTGADFRRMGHAGRLLGSSLKWAKKSSARYAWLQVVSDNKGAIDLYKKFGFEELYRYSYRKFRMESPGNTE